MLVILLGMLANRATLPPVPDDRGILPCPAGAERDLLSPAALQCWLPTGHGQWRTLARRSAHGALVVEAETTALEDAEEIAERFVSGLQGRFFEILVYVQSDAPTDPRPIRRVRWMRGRTLEVLDFAGPPAF
jgi:hypothetical protein